MAALIIAIFPQNSSRGNWEEKQDRTDPNSRFELARKSAWLLAFRQFGLPKWKHDFECRTFDLSDNSPYISSVILAPEECKKNTQERYEIVKSEPAQSPVRRTFSVDETAVASKNFESFSLRPLRYISMLHRNRFILSYPAADCNRFRKNPIRLAEND
ncbi:MAG: hypothetical protein KH136_03155 [Oscillibacter sp.]|nr:hypothetical protein [Oscillibacter sp.]